jgi:hypothetical protein
MLQSTARAFALMTLVLAAAIALIGCGDDDDDRGTADVAPTATASPSPTEVPHPPHSVSRIGSSEAGGGQIILDALPIALVVPSACVGGSGDACEGGTLVYTGDSPGFGPLPSGDAQHSIFKLPDGVAVSIQLTHAESGAAAQINGATLDMPGESALIGTAPELHNHPDWTLFGAGSELPAAKRLSFRLTAPGYESSQQYTVSIEVFDAAVPHDEDDDDGARPSR